MFRLEEGGELLPSRCSGRYQAWGSPVAVSV